MSKHGAKILIVEDEEGIREGLCDLLAFHGHQPTGAPEGDSGLKEALSGAYALLILDVMLPYVDGFEICRRARARFPEQPILMLTAKGAEGDVVKGFKAGCDDYVTKPFSLKELMARVEALLRRAGRTPVEEPDCFTFAGWSVNPDDLFAERQGARIPLSRREINLMALFHREKGRIVSRRRLLREVWEQTHVETVNTRTVDMHIAKLRKKIDAGAASCIETVRGEGYRFVGDAP